jgi:hypothetical protein
MRFPREVEPRMRRVRFFQSVENRLYFPFTYHRLVGMATGCYLCEPTATVDRHIKRGRDRPLSARAP